MLSPDVARFRALALAAARSFFADRGYLEVEVPILAPALIPEAHLEVFRTELVSPYGPPEPRFLIPSPEIWMKRLLAEGYGDIFYLGRSFRNAESTSRLHRPEFTMLEWYTVERPQRPADYLQSADLTGELLAWLVHELARAPAGPPDPACGAPPLSITVEEAFTEWAGARAGVFDRHDGMRETALRLGMHVGGAETEEDLFQRILLTHVEPRLPDDRPVFLMDYPALVPTLATERWELYLRGMEIANCYTEERDRAKLAAFLDRESARKSRALVPHPVARELLGFAQAPPCTGVALGVDRLVMALLGLRDIGGVIF